MTRFLTMILAFAAFVVHGQTFDEQFPTTIKTTRLAAQTNIPGTRMFMVIPEGFKLSATAPALEKGEAGFIQVMDLVGGNFYTNAATFSREKFEQKGLSVLGYKHLLVNGFPAKLALVQAGPQMKMYNLVFGDSTFSTMVMGMFNPADSKTEAQVRQTLLSFYYDKASKIDPFAAAPFVLDDTKSAFKFAKFAASMYIYSLGGVEKKSYENEPNFIVASLPDAGETLETIANGMAEMIKGQTVKNASTNSVNGLLSLKREVYGTLKGKPALLFQHLVLIGQSVIVMQGVADDKLDTYAIEFAKLSNTIKKK